MIKKGQRVSLVHNMHRLGTVTEVKFAKPSSWIEGGTTVDGQLCIVKFDDGKLETHRLNDIRPEYFE